MTYRQYGIGEEWGPALGTSWFHLNGAAPEAVRDRVELLVDSAGPDRSPGFQAEGLVYRPDGSAVQGRGVTWFVA